MSPLQPMMWTLIVISFVVVARWIIHRPAGGGLDIHHADRMTNAANYMWRTGYCSVCDNAHFDHDDDCALHIWLGGDQPSSGVDS
jgi:hypothetical protein